VTIPLPELVPATPIGGVGKAYVTNFGNNTVTIIDTSSQSVVGTITVGIGPQGIAVSTDGLNGYTANQTARTISVIDLTTDTVTATWTLPTGAIPNLCILTRPGGNLWVSDLAQSTNALVLIYNTTTQTLTNVIGTGSNDEAYGLVLSPTIFAAYIAAAVSNRLVTNQPNPIGNSYVTVGKTPIDVAVSPDGLTAYVTNNQDSSVSIIDTTTNTVTGTITTPSLPFGIALDPTGAHAFVTTSGGTLTVIDTSARTVITTITVGGDTYFPRVDPTGSFVYVPTSSGNTVAIVSTSSYTVVTTITGLSDTRVVAFGPAS
jgi:YVTN family beta-propeller protein